MNSGWQGSFYSTGTIGTHTRRLLALEVLLHAVHVLTENAASAGAAVARQQRR